MLAPGIPTDIAKFAIGFDQRDRARVHALWERIFDSNQWSEGELTKEFEGAWTSWNGLDAVAFNGWTGAALAALEWAGVRGETVLCPSNTFMATPLSAITAGARVEFVDCNRDDLCMSFEDFERKVHEHKPKAAFLVHIGGHIAFDSEGMPPGLYKYLVFEPIEKSTGKVYDEPCHRILGHQVDLPNTDWVAANHWCVPLYYRPEEL